MEVLLVRHAAHCDLDQRLSGRMPERPLSSEGKRHAAELAASLCYEPLAEVHASPLDRARETAAAIGDVSGASVIVEAALDEIDFGEWSGARFEDLAGDPRWHDWNARRAIGCAPGGEAMADAQERILSHLSATASRLPRSTVAMVTHCDMIRSVLCAATSRSLDAIHDFDVGPGSVHRVVCDGADVRMAQSSEVAA